MNWLAALNHLKSTNQPGVLVTLVTVRGHAPRDPGAKMVVGLSECWDSVGGGNLEATAVERARASLRLGSPTPELLTLRLTDQAHNEHGRQCCGGEVTLLLEPVLRVLPQIAVFGVGHVGLELARILSRLPLHLHLVDSREAQLTPERLSVLGDAEAQLHLHLSPLPEMTLADLPAGTHLLIMTHDHAEDAALCDAALRRPDLGFIGLIGSSGKWSRLSQQLRREGHSERDLARITTPIGLPEIAGKTPAVVALSVAAQLLQVLQPSPQVRPLSHPHSPAPEKNTRP